MKKLRQHGLSKLLKEAATDETVEKLEKAWQMLADKLRQPGFRAEGIDEC